EAKGILKQIFVMETAYRQEYNVYHANKDTIGVVIPSNARYAYNIGTADSTHFIASAGADLDDDATRDSMTIDTSGVIIQRSNDAAD
ncbi:MAG TPA: hypothetical protein VGB16_04475, partial [candidate division Zixibacteria bacterium]